MDGIDGGLLLVRVFIGALMLAHGTQQLFGWFHGYGITGSGQFLVSLGYRHGRAMAIVTGLVEAGGGGLLALGAGTAPAVAGLIGLSLNIAVAGHGRNGFWNHNVPPGWEYPAAAGKALGWDPTQVEVRVVSSRSSATPASPVQRQAATR